MISVFLCRRGGTIMGKVFSRSLIFKIRVICVHLRPKFNSYTIKFSPLNEISCALGRINGNYFFYGQDRYLTILVPTTSIGFLDGFDDFIGQFLSHHHFKFEFDQEIAACSFPRKIMSGLIGDLNFCISKWSLL